MCSPMKPTHANLIAAAYVLHVRPDPFRGAKRLSPAAKILRRRFRAMRGQVA